MMAFRFARSPMRLVLGLGIGLFSLSPTGTARSHFAIAQPLPATDTVSVLTYNVHGLPWPFAIDRPAAFHRIAARLVALRHHGDAPQIAVLQEAFTADARHIAREAGYRYVARGPSADTTASDDADPADTAYLAAARWTKGETEGPVLNSGLEILSDYPILAVKTVAYPRWACAGYDCLANKGAVLARIAVPGASTPVDVVTTHLNCRERTGVSDARADSAYRQQVRVLAGFIAANHDPALPLIVAGDFNVGPARDRDAMLDAAATNWGGGHGDRVLVAMNTQTGLSGEALRALTRNKDLQFFVSSPTMRLEPSAIDVPFGRGPDGTMLSDHIGYIARYRLVAAPPRVARSPTNA